MPGRSALAIELGALASAFVVALLPRLPYLWEIPRYTDELQEVLWSVAIARGEILPLTAVDSYYGPVWSYLLAALFVVLGTSPALPRLVAALLGGALVVLTYLFAREAAGRWPAAIAAGLLLTSGGHIVINSHTARSNSTTPLFTTAALWLLLLALERARWDAASGSLVARQPRPWMLVPAGVLLGLALQTHLSVIALLPGIGLYAFWRGHGLLRTRWPYLATLGAVAGYSNMLLYNALNSFWSFRHARSLQEGYTAGHSSGLEFFLTNLQSLLQSLSRLLSGTIDVADSPSRFVYVALALAGLALLARRGGLLLALAGLSMVVVLPLFNPRYGPILSGRYLIPLLPLAFTGVGCVIVVAARRFLPRRASWQLVAALVGLAAALFPLMHLAAYYREALADGRTNAPLHTLAASAVAARQPDEVVLLDEGLAQEALGAGGTDLKALRMLLATQGVPYEIAKVSDTDTTSGSSAIVIMESKKRGALPRALTVARLSSEVESASGSEHRYAVYRISMR